MNRDAKLAPFSGMQARAVRGHHTKGIWYVAPDGKRYSFKIMDDQGADIAQVCAPGGTIDEAEANAHLMSAAPALLVALRETMHTLVMLNEALNRAHADRWVRAESVVEQARLAIAKATWGAE